LNIGSETALELVTQSILEKHNIPSQSGQISHPLVTPEGAALLAALSPQFVQSEDAPQTNIHTGLGLGLQALDTIPNFGALRVFTLTGEK
jgi:uncharacterized protein (DUF111 family)